MPHQSMWTNCTLNKCGWHTGIFLKIISNFKPEIEKIIILDNLNYLNDLLLSINEKITENHKNTLIEDYFDIKKIED